MLAARQGWKRLQTAAVRLTPSVFDSLPTDETASGLLAQWLPTTGGRTCTAVALPARSKHSNPNPDGGSLHGGQHSRAIHQYAPGDEASSSNADRKERPGTGWTSREVVNVPNALSVFRLLSGPGVAALILNGAWGPALGLLAGAGLTDWADGFVARRFNQGSVLGSYLDPLADKVLVGCAVGALGFEGSIHPVLVGIIIGRDVFLVAGAFAFRLRTLSWQRVSLGEFFRIAPPMPSSTSSSPSNAHPSGSPAGPDALASAAEKGQIGSPRHGHPGVETLADAPGQQPGPAKSAPPAQFIQPLAISKINTVLQLALVGGCITHCWQGVPSEDGLWCLGAATAACTVASCGAYVRAYFNGTLVAAQQSGQ